MSGVQVLFLVYAIGVCLGALMVVLSQNVVRMAFWLIVSLGSVSGLFFLLSADFVAATQLLIYVGGTAVLLIFGVMLTASGPYSQLTMTPGEGVLAGGIGLLLLATIFASVKGVDWNGNNQKLLNAKVVQTAGWTGQGYNKVEQGNTARPIGMALLGVRPDRDLNANQTGTSPGYLLPFEIISIHLLVVLIGAAYLARAKKRVQVTSEGGAS